MSGDENKASRTKPRDEAGECLAGLCVEMVRGFVQDKNEWVPDDGAGYGESLAFAAGKRADLIADDCVEPPGESLHDRVETA